MGKHINEINSGVCSDSAMTSGLSSGKTAEYEYKKIDMKGVVLHSGNGSASRLMQMFNDFFDRKDIYMDLSINDSIRLLLREVDVKKLKQVCDFLFESTKQSVFQDILVSVESIKSYGIKGEKRNYVDYNKERKTRGRKKKEATRRKYFYARGNDFSKEVNAFPKELENKIISNDCLSVLKEMPKNSVDVIFTSPPYNFGLDYEENQDADYWGEYFERLFSIFSECIRVVKYGGRIIVNVQPLFSDYIPSHHIISNYFISQKLIWKGEILWEKNNYNCKYTAWGSWKSPSNPYLKYTWEFVEVFCKGDLKKPGQREDIDITGDEFKKWVVSKWSIAPERKMKKYGHPAMFPGELAERVLKLFSYKNDLILDPFNGVGTTTYVAKKLERRYCGIDISRKYCNVAKTRLDDLTVCRSIF